MLLNRRWVISDSRFQWHSTSTPPAVRPGNAASTSLLRSCPFRKHVGHRVHYFQK